MRSDARCTRRDHFRQLRTRRSFLLAMASGSSCKTPGANCEAIVRAGLDGLGLTPAKIHRAAAKGLLERGFGWNAARNPSAYRRIPKTDYAPSLDEMEQAIARCHPLEFV